MKKSKNDVWVGLFVVLGALALLAMDFILTALMFSTP